MKEKDEDTPIYKVRHTLSHVLAQSVREMDKDVKFAIGPVIDNGFYYDFEFAKKGIVGEDDLPALTKRMQEIVKEGFEPTRKEVSKDKALALFKDQPYKIELMEEATDAGEQLSIYTIGEFTDLCRGPHVDSSQDINPDAFTLTHIAGAYWRGNEKNTMLTRIYGIAFDTKEELEKYVEMRKEAEKRDHRKISKEQNLLVFSDLVGPGMPMFTPKGNTIRTEIINYSRELNLKLGFEEVHTPNINKAELFKISGHYDKFKEDMLTVHSQYSEEEFYLKPMNCPQHTQIFSSQPRSYRDLPIRYSDFATLYRDERPGELSGLTRLRAFAQDDGHIFCTDDQIESEISKVLDTIEEALKTYHIGYWMRLSLRDPSSKDKYLGDDTTWEESQYILDKLLKEKECRYTAEEGEAAFYGPKIDIVAVDALGREWQLSTVQLDFSMPIRFGLEYTDSDGSKKTPIMIHRALIGSPDRFIGILIEHYTGAFPLWLSPVQVKVLPISDKHAEYARNIFEKLKGADIRTELDDNSETLGKKIRNATLEKVPYTLVIGDKEVESQTVTLESRDRGKVGALSVDDLLAQLKEEIRTRA
jgi:threonyl-tRNA synthetase